MGAFPGRVTCTRCARRWRGMGVGKHDTKRQAHAGAAQSIGIVSADHDWPTPATELPAAPSARVRTDTPVRFTIPVRTKNGLNDREHWAAKAKRVKAERMATRGALLGA